MKERHVATALGRIAVAVDEGGRGLPVVFMHGVFLDRTLWSECLAGWTDRTRIFIDMPAHGASANVGHDWTLDDCVTMLEVVLDDLGVSRCVLIGHSWGSMTAVRAAAAFPSRIAGLGLFNTPFRRTTGSSRLAFTLQKLLVRFPRFYARQAAKSLYTKEALAARPELSTQMEERLATRPPKEISRAIDAVLLDADDATDLISGLKMPALAVVGEADYVGKPPGIRTLTVPGGHISPHEAPEQTYEAARQVVRLAEAGSA